MAGINAINGEIRRGPQSDSSSSGEASPRRPHKRSFSPPTDDDDELVVPPAADNDPPPQVDPPLLRQPVAFSWDSSSLPTKRSHTVPNTYEASLSMTPTPGKSYFLPGQEVPSTMKAAHKVKKTDASTKKRRTEQYSSQTNRFRLTGYDPTPTGDPPLRRGQGPYSSMYRSTPGTGHTSHGSAYPAPSVPSYSGYSGDSGSVASSSPAPDPPGSTEENAVPPQIISSPNKRQKPTHNRIRISPRKRRTSDATPRATGKSKESTSFSKVPAFTVATSSTVGPVHSSSSSRNSANGAYYRRDYERDLKANEHRSLHSSEGDPTVTVPHATNKKLRTQGGQSETAAAEKVDPQTAAHLSRQLRMVTLLIQDIRSGTTDHQLAEVRISLKPADTPQDGYWADARELSEKLQSSPCRIDGPAKVYTLRGKYRQFFLRVSAENIDEFISANIIVKPDRTLDIVVETLLPPGILPLPPNIPSDLRSPTESVRPPSPRTTQNRTVVGQTSTEQQERTLAPSLPLNGSKSFDGTRRQASPSTRPSTRDQSPHGSGPSQSGEFTPGDPPNKRRKGSLQEPLSTQLEQTFIPRHSPIEPRGYESPTSDEKPENLRELISKAVLSSIKKDPQWMEYLRARSAPQRVREILNQCRFAQRMMDIWVGQRAPFRSCHHVVEKTHIIRALSISDDSEYNSACTEILQLLSLYGANGQRYEDPRIIDMINDDSIPDPDANPLTQLLDLLREIDEVWVEGHPQHTHSSKQ